MIHSARVPIALLILLTTLVFFGSQVPATAAETKKPNIVFLFADDHGYQAVSAYGSKLNKTPNIDRLAQEGMRFDRCLVPNSICGPSRATVLTGKYSHINGFYNNTNSKFNTDQVTFPKLLKSAGYQTAMVGKWHLINNPTPAMFDFWEILPGQGQYYNPPMIRNGERVKHDGYTTDVITDISLDWLKKRDKNKPFLLMCHHKAPHREWEPNIKYLHMFDGVKFPEPETLFDDYLGRGLAEKSQGHEDRPNHEREGFEANRAADSYARAAQGMGCLLRAAQRGVPQSESAREGPRPLEVPALHARLPRLHQLGR